jgi:lysine 6-dehydrogenase
MSFKYAVLGAGRQGVASAYDMAKFGDGDEVILGDINLDVAETGAEKINGLLGREVARAIHADVSSIEELKPKLEGINALIAGVHYPFNLALTEMAIDLGASMADFGGNTGIVRKQMELTERAKDAGISVVPDCGMGPGMNISLGCYVMELIDDCHEVLIWDGGLTQDPKPPWNYAMSFHIGGLTNEYYGDAYFLKDGKVTPVPCFEGYEMVEFPKPIGKLEAFVTSGGLSTAPWTFAGKLQRLENKTLRYPGHVAQFKAFRDLGLFEEEPMKVGDVEIVPREFYHELLGPRIMDPDLKDVCVMRVKGIGSTKEAVVELIDRYDEETGFLAMQRLTGWHASIIAILAAKGEVEKGVVPVELAVTGGKVVEEARRRGFMIEERVREI